MKKIKTESLNRSVIQKTLSDLNGEKKYDKKGT